MSDADALAEVVRSRSPPVIERTSRVAPHDRCKLALSDVSLGV